MSAEADASQDADMTDLDLDAAPEGMGSTLQDTSAAETDHGLAMARRAAAIQTAEIKTFFELVRELRGTLYLVIFSFKFQAERFLEWYQSDQSSDGQKKDAMELFAGQVRSFLVHLIAQVQEDQYRRHLPAWLESFLVPPTPTARLQVENEARIYGEVLASIRRIGRPTVEQLFVHLVVSCVAVQDELKVRKATTPDKDAVRRDFQVTFRGSGHEYLAEHIRIMRTIYDERKHYGRIVPIVQSSGSGKSRTVDQLMRTSHLGLTVCFRKDDDEVSWPPRDDAAASLFGRPFIGEEERSAWVMAWLEAFAHESANEVEQVASDSGPAELVRNFHVHLHCSQDPASPTPGSMPLHEVAVTRSSNRNRPMLQRDVLLQKIRKRCKATFAELRQQSLTYETLTVYLRTDCTEAFKRLQSVVTSAISAKKLDPDACFVLAFDEAGYLGNEDLGCFRRTWHQMGEAMHAGADRLVLVLLDTNSNISTLVGEAALLRSGRLATVQLVLLPPFTSLPHDVGWDHLSDDERKAHGKKWSQLLKHLRLMGRPLLNNDHLLRTVADPPEVGRVSLPKVQAKLLSTKTPQLPDFNRFSTQERITGFFVSDPEHSKAVDEHLAVLGQRLSLEFIGFQGYVSVGSFLERQVSSHLRTVQKCDPLSSLIVTGTPSEPLLSIAAADLFRKQTGEDRAVEKRWRSAIRALAVSRQFYGLTTGEDGEVVARLLLAMATDLASSDAVDQKARQRGAASKEVLWEQGHTTFPIDAWSVLKVLLGKDRLSELLKPYTGDPADASISHNTRSGKKRAGFETFARSARVSFTHFSRLSEEIREITKGQLAGLFAAHVALIGIHHQRDWDLLIPIYIDDGWNGDETIIDEEKCSFILVQVKNRADEMVATRIPPPTVKSSTEEQQFEYITLFLQLYAPTARESSCVSYLCDTVERHQEHRLTVSNVEQGFGVMDRLEQHAPRAIDDMFSLLGRSRTRLFHELDNAQIRPAISQMQTSKYLRRHV